MELGAKNEYMDYRDHLVSYGITDEHAILAKDKVFQTALQVVFDRIEKHNLKLNAPTYQLIRCMHNCGF